MVGWRFVGELDSALESSLGVTAEALEALDATVALADETIGQIEEVLSGVESTTGRVGATVEDTSTALEEIARLSEQEIADSLAAVEGSLPALIDVAGVIDRTLGALNNLPFGPDYDPEQPFDESLRDIQRELDGLPEGLREQAQLIRDARQSLAVVGRSVDALADDLGAVTATLGSADQLLDEYAATTSEAQQVLSESTATLGTQLTLARGLIVGLGLVFLGGQLVPLGLGWLLLRPDVARSFLAS